jgi:hypothetical protein
MIVTQLPFSSWKKYNSTGVVFLLVLVNDIHHNEKLCSEELKIRTLPTKQMRRLLILLSTQQNIFAIRQSVQSIFCSVQKPIGIRILNSKMKKTEILNNPFIHLI